MTEERVWISLLISLLDYARLLFIIDSVHYFYGQVFWGWMTSCQEDFWIAWLLYADDVVLLASLSQDLPGALGH